MVWLPFTRVLNRCKGFVLRVKADNKGDMTLENTVASCVSALQSMLPVLATEPNLPYFRDNVYNVD